MAVQLSRKVVLAAAYESDERLKALTDASVATILASDDLQEGLTAFIGKRPALWEDR